MDTAFLKGFLLTVETGSMSEAARRLDLTPAAVAQQIRALERSLGTSLVSRAGRSVKPTAAGLRLVVYAQPLVMGVDALKGLINTDTLTGELRIGAINTALLSFLPKMLKSFSNKHPEVSIYIQSGHSPELIRHFESDGLDAVICIHPKFSFSKSLQWQAFRDEPLLLLAPASSMSDRPRALLEQYPLIRYDRSLAGGKQADQYLRQLKVKPKEFVELSSIMAIALMVESGLGVSVVPDIDSKLVNGLAIRKILLNQGSAQRTIGMLSQRQSIKSTLLRRLFECYERQG